MFVSNCTEKKLNVSYYFDKQNSNDNSDILSDYFGDNDSNYELVDSVNVRNIIDGKVYARILITENPTIIYKDGEEEELVLLYSHSEKQLYAYDESTYSSMFKEEE